MKKSAILLTCHNKCDVTLKCLDLLFKIIDEKFDVFLVNDGSTDDTYKRVSNTFPNIVIIEGDGNLFWTRGMSLAWITASKFDYDFYIWLNNDVFLFNNSFQELFSVSKSFFDKAIVSGIVSSRDGDSIYGGYDVHKNLIMANGKTNSISYLNGNFVLIPKFVFERVGSFDPMYHHDLGDVDYGFTARKLGISVVTTRISIGIGEINNICRERLSDSNIINRFKKLYSPLGSSPDINFYFRWKHISLFNAVIYFLFQHFLNFIPDSLNKLLFGEKYT